MNEKKDIIFKVFYALDKFYHFDKYLLQNNVNEISITHKLACYLQDLFYNFNCDIEFNRNIFDKKRLYNDSLRKPDIIIHKRGSNKFNYIAIEVKKTNNTNKNTDFKKISAMLKEFKYRYGIYIEFNVDNINQKNFIKNFYFFNLNNNKISTIKFKQRRMCYE